MFINSHRIMLIIATIAMFASAAFAATQGTVSGAFASAANTTVSTLNGTSIFPVNRTMGVRPATPGGAPSTCDTPLGPPPGSVIFGQFEAKSFSFIASHTGCMTVVIRSTESVSYTAAAYTGGSFMPDNPNSGMLGTSRSYVGSGSSDPKSAFFSFKVQSGTLYEIALWTIAINTTTGRFSITLNDSLAEPSDFDGDGQTDSAVFRPSTGVWYILQSSNGTVRNDFFGSNGDVPLDGDFDGDGKSDAAVFRPSDGTWYFKRSSNNTFYGAYFGLGTDKPAPGDYDRDGITDIGAYRDGQWLISASSGMHNQYSAYTFGAPGDIPLSSQRK